MNKEEIYEKYPFLKNEDVEDDDLEGVAYWLDKEAQEALSSYKKDEVIRYCYKCRQPLEKGTMAYDENWHFDSCI